GLPSRPASSLHINTTAILLCSPRATGNEGRENGSVSLALEEPSDLLPFGHVLPQNLALAKLVLQPVLKAHHHLAGLIHSRLRPAEFSARVVNVVALCQNGLALVAKVRQNSFWLIWRSFFQVQARGSRPLASADSSGVFAVPTSAVGCATTA